MVVTEVLVTGVADVADTGEGVTVTMVVAIEVAELLGTEFVVGVAF